MGGRRLRIVSLVALGAIFAALGTATYFYREDIKHARNRVSRGSLIAYFRAA